MKTTVTLLFTFFIMLTVQAQDQNSAVVVKEAHVKTSVVTQLIKRETQPVKIKVARLFINKNSSIIKALSFSTKRNSAKMA